jgi:hypothetical protein
MELKIAKDGHSTLAAWKALFARFEALPLAG